MALPLVARQDIVIDVVGELISRPYIEITLNLLARFGIQVKRDGWHEQGMLAVSVDDNRLTWPERELVEQLGTKLYGKRQSGKEVRHG